MKKLFLFLLVVISSCSTSDYTEELGEGYLFVSESNAVQFVTGPNDSTRTGIIPCTIEALDYDNDHIIARQKDNPNCDLNYTSKSISYWIIEKKRKTCYGPLDSLWFGKKRIELSVSNSLNLNK